jgi:hypothetical protein
MAKRIGKSEKSFLRVVGTLMGIIFLPIVIITVLGNKKDKNK